MEKRPLEGQTFRVLVCGSASRFEFYPGPVVGGVAAKVSVPRLGCFLVVGALRVRQLIDSSVGYFS